jgi:hypothetical protein
MYGSIRHHAVERQPPRPLDFLPLGFLRRAREFRLSDRQSCATPRALIAGQPVPRPRDHLAAAAQASLAHFVAFRAGAGRGSLAM